MAGTVFRRCGCGWKVPTPAQGGPNHSERITCAKCGRGDGFKFGYIVDVGRGADGKRRQKQAVKWSTKREAEAALAKLATDVDAGTYTEVAKITVAEAVEQFLAAVKPTPGASGRRHRGKVGISTWDGYRVYLTAYVVPEWGGRLLRDVTGRDVNRLYDRLETSGKRRGGGLSGKSMANLHGSLSRLFKWALAQDPPLVAKNPLVHVDAPKPGKAQREVWTAEQLGRFLVHVRQHHAEKAAFYYLASTTGMRRGEIAGLTWDDLDLEDGSATVEWTLGLLDAQPIWKHQPKSEAGERTMALDPATVAVLREHKARQAKDRLAFGGAWQGSYTDAHGATRSGLVFTWADGSVVNPERWTVWMRDLCAEADLPQRSPHELRHSYATIAASQADSFADVIVLSRRLGHKTVAMTLDTYGHALPRQDVSMAKGVAELIMGA